MRKRLIGLTGNIACGKSSVAAMLGDLGAEVIDADKLVHRLMEPGTESWRTIRHRFGEDVLRPDGTINRPRLGDIVFRDPEALRDLESILHPPVRKLAEARIAASRRPAVILEAIKLIEAGWDQRVNSLWVVACSRDQQIERLKRDPWNDSRRGRAASRCPIPRRGEDRASGRGHRQQRNPRRHSPPG